MKSKLGLGWCDGGLVISKYGFDFLVFILQNPEGICPGLEMYKTSVHNVEGNEVNVNSVRIPDQTGVK